MKTNNSKQTRNINTNFIYNVKFWACISVLCVHIRHNLQWKIPLEDLGPKTALFFSVIYQLFIPCVPLFIISTGFLMLNKQFSKQYFLNLIKLYSLYLICSIISFIILFAFKKTEMNFSEIYTSIINFKLIKYSWYVEMYLGLAFLIPLANKIIGNSSKAELAGYILALLTAISLPTFVNTVPQISKYIHLPNYWSSFYPVLYYLIGSYIRKYSSGKSKITFTISSLLLTILIGIAINFFNATPYTKETEGGYASLLIVIQSVLVFLFIKKMFTKSNQITRFIAELTLPIYLMSFCVDTIVYPYLIKKLGFAKNILPYAPLVVICIFLISLSLAYLAQFLNKLIWPATSTISKINSSKETTTKVT